MHMVTLQMALLLVNLMASGVNNFIAMVGQNAYTLISDLLDFCLQNLSNFNMDLKDLLEEYMFKFEIHNTQSVIEIGI